MPPDGVENVAAEELLFAALDGGRTDEETALVPLQRKVSPAKLQVNPPQHDGNMPVFHPSHS